MEKPVFNIGIVVKLQQKNNSCNTIKTWNNLSSLFAIVDEDWYVSKEYPIS